MMTFKDFINESINDKAIFKALFIVGIPGAGKSYTIKQLKGTVSPMVINTDIAVEYLVKKLKMPSTTETWPIFRDDAKRITEARMFQHLNGMLPLFVDGTSNDISNVLSRAGILESIGYDVGMVFIDTTLDAALNRAEQRGKEINRHVDPKFIEKVFDLSQENKEYFRTKFGFFKEINNSPGELNDAAISKIFNQVSSFYNEPLKNPVGIRSLTKLKEAKQKYLVPLVFEPEDLRKKCDSWYRK